MPKNNNKLDFQRLIVVINVSAALLLTACAPFPQRVADELEPSTGAATNNFAPNDDLAIHSDQATVIPVGEQE